MRYGSENSRYRVITIASSSSPSVVRRSVTMPSASTEGTFSRSSSPSSTYSRRAGRTGSSFRAKRPPGSCTKRTTCLLIPRSTSTSCDSGHSSSGTANGSARSAACSERARSRKCESAKLVPEVAAPGEDHRRARMADGCNHVVVAARTARLHDGPRPGLERELRTVREREEGVGRERRSCEVVAELARFLDGDPHGVDAAHLSRADADRLQILDEDDGVRGNVLADAPREDEVAPLLLVGRAADHLPTLAFLDLAVRVLDEQAAQDPLVMARVGIAAPLAVDQDADVLLLAKCIERP